MAGPQETGRTPPSSGCLMLRCQDHSHTFVPRPDPGNQAERASRTEVEPFLSQVYYITASDAVGREAARAARGGPMWHRRGLSRRPGLIRAKRRAAIFGDSASSSSETGAILESPAVRPGRRRRALRPVRPAACPVSLLPGSPLLPLWPPSLVAFQVRAAAQSVLHPEIRMKPGICQPD